MGDVAGALAAVLPGDRIATNAGGSCCLKYGMKTQVPAFLPL